MEKSELIKQCLILRVTVAYLGFHKGSKFSLAVSAYTKGRGGQTRFSYFFLWRKNFFLPKGAMTQFPLPQIRHWLVTKQIYII